MHILGLVVALASPARAGTYEADVAIPSEHPSWLAPGREWGAGRALYHVSHPDVSVSAADSRVTCYVQNNWLSVEFAATAGDYPTAPFTTSCSYGSDTLNVHVVFMSPATDTALQSPVIEDDGSVTITRVTGAAYERLYELPASSSAYRTGQVEATLGGVRCRVETISGQQFVRVRISPSATMGNGSCTLPINGGGSYPLTLHLAEADI